MDKTSLGGNNQYNGQWITNVICMDGKKTVKYFKKPVGMKNTKGILHVYMKKNQCTWIKTADIGIHNSELHGYQYSYIGRANHN